MTIQKNSKLNLFLGALLLCSSLTSAHADTPMMIHDNLASYGLDLIYGKDDRYDVEEYDDLDFQKKANSVALRVNKKRLTTDRDDPTRILFPQITLGNVVGNMCQDEPFNEQISLGDCSGFLAGPNKLVTAGHCALSENDCANYKWVFNYKADTTELHSNQVYSCKKIISQRFVYSKDEISDYAVIELDRDVKNYVPLKMRKFGRTLLNTPLLVIGHPLGLPQKITDGGVVQKFNEEESKNKFKSFLLRKNYFVTNLDTYAGNSGSPVFNTKTGKVEGILIQGAEDFTFNYEKGCMESNRLTNHHLESQEKVFRIHKIPGL